MTTFFLSMKTPQRYGGFYCNLARSSPLGFRWNLQFRFRWNRISPENLADYIATLCNRNSFILSANQNASNEVSSFEHNLHKGNYLLRSRYPISRFNFTTCRIAQAFHLRFYGRTASLVMLFYFLFSGNYQDYSKDKRLFTNKTSIKEKIFNQKR